MSIFNVKSGDIEYVSDMNSHIDAAGEIIDKTFNGCTLGNEIVVTDMMTGKVETFDTYDILEELNFEWED
jgi:hypothetical protein